MQAVEHRNGNAPAIGAIDTVADRQQNDGKQENRLMRTTPRPACGCRTSLRWWLTQNTPAMTKLNIRAISRAE